MTDTLSQDPDAARARRWYHKNKARANAKRQARRLRRRGEICPRDHRTAAEDLLSRLNEEMSGKKNESKCWHRSKIPPDLTVDWLVEQLDAGCPRSGYKWPEDVIIPEHLRPSLDRIDSRHGYTKDNVQVVIRIYNYAKNKFSDYDVIESARMIVAHADQRHGLVNTLADMRVGFAPMLHHD